MAVVVVALFSGSQWTVPSDYGTPSTVDCIGGGEGGFSNSSGGGGGGGGAFARRNNPPLVPGSIIQYAIGGVPSGSHAKDTWFQASNYLLAKGAVGETGGLASQSVGDLVFSGGSASGSGGGAAGAAGPGGNAGGGHAGNGNGGAGGAGGNPGGNGTEYQVTATGQRVGSGGGGLWPGAVGGDYGGGSAGNNSGGLTQAGRGGLIVITYTSKAPGPPEPSPGPPGSRRRVGGVSVSG